MKYQHVFINNISYVLPPEKVTTCELELRLKEVYDELGIPLGQLEYLTKIRERRYWPSSHRLSDHAALAAQTALTKGQVDAQAIELLIYCGVGRDQLEPATACSVANTLNIAPNAQVYDVSNACLGVLNGILLAANAIELRQIHAALVVSTESCREIIEKMIGEICQQRTMSHFISALATLTGGSGAVAVLLTDESSNNPNEHRLLGGVMRQDSAWHALCHWGGKSPLLAKGDITMRTDSIAVLKNGIALGKATYQNFLQEMSWQGETVDKFICHQVGEANQLAILNALNIPKNRDFTTYQTLGNMGTVALPITAAIADEAGFLKKGDRVAFLGIGSGLNCLMLGLEW